MIQRITNISLSLALTDLKDILEDVACVAQLHRADLKFIDQLKDGNRE